VRRPLIIMFLGVPGSGKSYFARQLAAKTHAVRFNSDAMRLALFGSVEEVEKRRNDPAMNVMTFGTIDYVAEQVLSAGHDVVYDAHHNRRDLRKKFEQMALLHGAIPLVVWMKTPQAVALSRAQNREATVDQLRLSPEVVREVVRRQLANFDEPDEHENVITIDGTVDFEQQIVSYTAQLEKITRSLEYNK